MSVVEDGMRAGGKRQSKVVMVVMVSKESSSDRRIFSSVGDLVTVIG